MSHTYAVLGLGTFGYQMAICLQRGGAQVLAVDLNEAVVQRISAHVTKAVCADVSSEEALRNLGVHEADGVIVSMPDHFDSAVLITHLLKEAGVVQILVQVESEAEAGAITAVGATMAILPERDIAHRIATKLLTPDIADQIPLSEDVSVIELPCPAGWANKTLLELDVRKKHHVYIIGLKRETGNASRPVRFEIIPPPEQPLKSGDTLLVLGKSNRLVTFKHKVSGGAE